MPRATALPIPRVPPVTRAFLPSSATRMRTSRCGQERPNPDAAAMIGRLLRPSVAAKVACYWSIGVVNTRKDGWPTARWRPRVTPDGTRLLSTSVFMKDGLVIRMIEIEGNLPELIKHIASEPSIQNVERELDKYLVEEDKRDASTPEGARDFFRRALMGHVKT